MSSVLGGLPTLLEQGSLREVAKSGFKETQKKLDTYPRAGDYVLEKIKELAAGKERVIILESETGSGKSTYLMNQIRKNASSLFPESKDKYILVTEPRVLTTIDIPSGMARDRTNYPELEFGKNIGYSTGPFKNPSQRGGLLYSTVGVPLAQIQYNEDGFIRDRYGFIIVDEAHEQDKELIIFLYMLRSFLARNKGRRDCPFVILMSATLDIYKFANYFDTNKIISVRGLTFPITAHFPESGADNYLLAAAERVIELSKKDDDPIRRDILIFLPGLGEIKKVRSLITEMDTADQLVCLTLSGETVRSNSKEVQLMVDATMEDVRKYYKRPKVNRRVALATNVAETGITIDTLKYVLDSGWTRAPEFNPVHDLMMIISKGAAQSSVRQRKGRVGRKFPGDYYPLYTEKTKNALPAYSLSPIYTSNIDNILLFLFDYQKRKENKEPQIPQTIEPLATENVVRSVEKMRVLGFLEEDSYNLTRLGHIAEAFPHMDGLEQIRTILASYIYGISLEDIISITLFLKVRADSILSTRKPKFIFTDLLDKLGLKLNSYFINALMADEFIRWWFIVEYYHQLAKKHKNKLSKIRKAMEDMAINFDEFIEVFQKRREVFETIEIFGMKDVHPRLTIKDFNDDLMNTIARFKGCFYEGFKLNYAILNSENLYVTRTGIKFDHFFYLGTETKPRTILFDSLRVLNKTKSGKYHYETIAGQISVLDGFLAVCVGQDLS